MRQIAQTAEGVRYHQEMQAADHLLAQADELEKQAPDLALPKAQTEATDQRTIRNKDLAKIHLFKKQAGLDDDSYRDMLEQLTGKRSASKLNARERVQVISYLKTNLPKPTKSHYPGKPNNLNSKPQLQKIEALLSEAKYPWSYAKAIAKRMYNKHGLEFCSSKELSGVINALIKDAEKKGRRTS